MIELDELIFALLLFLAAIGVLAIFAAMMIVQDGREYDARKKVEFRQED